MASLPFPAVCCGISVRIGQCPPQPPLACSVAGSPLVISVYVYYYRTYEKAVSGGVCPSPQPSLGRKILVRVWPLEVCEDKDCDPRSGPPPGGKASRGRVALAPRARAGHTDCDLPRT